MGHIGGTIAVVIGLVAAVISTDASAQAFTQPAGKGRVIASLLYSESDHGFDARGRSIDIDDYGKAELYLLAEYGVTDDLTLLATPSLRRVTIQNAEDSFGLGYVDVGARYRLAASDGFVFSVQGSARVPGQRDRSMPAQIGSTDMEYDARGQAGYAFGGGSFAIVEGGYRLRDGDPPNEVHADATLGIRATERLLLIANSYNVFSDGRGGGVFTSYRYHNGFLSAAYDVSPRVTLQLGVLGTIAGRNALRERGAFGGVWFRF